MPLDLRSQEEFVAAETQAIQALLTRKVLFSPGSISRALVETHGRTAIWLESLIQYVLAKTRLATSTGEDADTFVEDFGLERKPGVAASGQVDFTSFSTTEQRSISALPGASLVTTPSGLVSYAVYPDPNYPYYNPVTNSYIMDIGVPTISVPVRATTTGVNGNTLTGTITVINSPIPGVDTVTNSEDFENGEDAQSDEALRKYFVDYINSLSRATRLAIAFAIESVQTGILYSIKENVDYTTGDPRLGYFYAIIDDGSGNPPQSLIDAVTASVELYRGLTIIFEIKPPVVVNADIGANIVLPVGYTNSNLVPRVKQALIDYIKTIPMGGGTLYYNRLPQIIYNVILSEINNDVVFLDQFHVISLTLNGGTSDITSTSKQAIRAGDLSGIITS